MSDEKTLLFTADCLNGGYFRVYYLPKKLRKDKLKTDLYEFEMFSPSSKPNSVKLHLREWEALTISMGLIAGVLERKFKLIEVRKSNVLNVIGR